MLKPCCLLRFMVFLLVCHCCLCTSGKQSMSEEKVNCYYWVICRTLQSEELSWYIRSTLWRLYCSSWIIACWGDGSHYDICREERRCEDAAANCAKLGILMLKNGDFSVVGSYTLLLLLWNLHFEFDESCLLMSSYVILLVVLWFFCYKCLFIGYMHCVLLTMMLLCTSASLYRKTGVTVKVKEGKEIEVKWNRQR